MQVFILHLSYEFLAGLRHRTLLLMNYLLPLGFFFMVGGMMEEVNPEFIEQIIPAMAIFAVLTGTIVGLPAPLVESREAGVLRNYRVNGIPSSNLMAVTALSTGLHVLLAAVIISAVAPAIFSAPVPESWPAFLLVFLAVAFACSGLGSLIGVISSSSRVNVLWSQLIFLPSILLSGMMVPADTLPETFVKIGHLLPASYAMQSFHGLAYGEEALYASWYGLLALLAGGIVAFMLAGYLFSWDDKNTVRRGHPALAVLALLPYLVGALFLV